MYKTWTWIPVFEEEADKAAAEAAAKEAADKAAAEEAAKKAAAGGGGERLFTQAEVNKIMAENKRALQTKNEQLIGELEGIKKSKGITAEQRVQLEAKIEELQNQLLTKEELAKKESDKLHKDYNRQIETLKNDREAWQGRFTEATIQRAITDAAVAGNAINPKQIVALLRPKTNLAQELDSEGNPTGSFIPKVKFDTSDKEGKPVVIEVTVPEAVKQMKDIEEYFNLFKGEGTGGVGATSRTGGKPADVKSLARDPAKYREARKAGKI